MEETVGLVWHRLVNHWANNRFSDAAVNLTQVSRAAAILFRALGGNHAIVVQAGSATTHQARRNWLQILAGSDRKADLAWTDHEALRLPPTIDYYPDTTLNRQLYFWLTALCAVDNHAHLPWLWHNQQATLQLIENYPGLATSYMQLVQAEIRRRPPIEKLPEDAAQQERAIRQALLTPGSVKQLPPARWPHAPILLWLRPTLSNNGTFLTENEQDSTHISRDINQIDEKRRVASRVELPKRKGGLLLFRPESIFSWGEYARVEHETSENDDDDLAQAADDLDEIAIATDSQRTAKLLRMTLDLPARHVDTSALDTDELLLPEWDYRTRERRPNQCRVKLQPMTSNAPCALPEHLLTLQRRLRRQFAALLPVRQRLKAQRDGLEIDIDPFIRHLSHQTDGDNRFYLDQRKHERDLSCLLLADLSLSTEAWAGENYRIIDAIRDSLFLFAETLSDIRDRFALYGFNSKLRTNIYLYPLKHFEDAYDAGIRGRISQISSAHYTRMGTAIRYATTILARQKTRERLLLILSDGKPNDSDHYEGRYGIEDTRDAILSAKKQGIRPFCITIDQDAHGYLPHIFGKENFTVIRKPSQLPGKLPLLYAQLTR